MVNQTIIAIMYDCDKTLTPHYMQDPIFEEYGVDAAAFWREKTKLFKEENAKGVRLADELAYLNLMLRYVKNGTFHDLSNAKLRELGGKIQLFPGLPDFFTRVKSSVEDDERYSQHGITIEQYVISTGLTEMIRGSVLNGYMDGIFGCEFVESEEGVIAEPAFSMSYTEKTRFLFEISKGCNIDPEIDVNSDMPQELRRIPMDQMIYVGDGPSDIPCLAIQNKRGGCGIVVYDPNSHDAFTQAFAMQQRKKITAFCPADYRKGSHTSKVLEHLARSIAGRIILRAEREQEERQARIHRPPQHIDV